MRNDLSFYQKIEPYFAISLVIGFLLLNGCSTSSPRPYSYNSGLPRVESIDVESYARKTIVDLQNSEPTYYRARPFDDLSGFIVDITGVIGNDLQLTKRVNDGNIREIILAKSKTEARTVRMIVYFARPLNYRVEEADDRISMTFTPR